MELRLPRLLVACACLGGANPAFGVTTIPVSLTNAQESTPVVPTLTNGAPRPVSFGTGTLVLNDAFTALTYNFSVFNIDFTGTQSGDVNDNLTNAHFHAGATVLPSGNQPVVFGFIGAPFNDNNPNDVVITPFTTGVGGTVSGKWDAAEGNGTSLTAQIENLLAGRAYVNFHTVQFGGGEIRGNIAAVVPEPSAWALMLVGFGAIGFAMRRKQRQMARFNFA